jgi:hypothetical protein
MSETLKLIDYQCIFLTNKPIFSTKFRYALWDKMELSVPGCILLNTRID